MYFWVETKDWNEWMDAPSKSGRSSSTPRFFWMTELFTLSLRVNGPVCFKRSACLMVDVGVEGLYLTISLTFWNKPDTRGCTGSVLLPEGLLFSLYTWYECLPAQTFWKCVQLSHSLPPMTAGILLWLWPFTLLPSDVAAWHFVVPENLTHVTAI